MNQIVLADNLEYLPSLPDNHFRLIYIDPPFNTGKVQKRDRISVVADEDNGSREGFGGKKYRVEKHVSPAYGDTFDDFVEFLLPRIEAAIPKLTADGSIFVHLDWREVHYVKVALDKLLGRDHFINEIIWSYDYGGRPRDRWPTKHDTLLWYVKNPKDYIFNYDDIDRIPYMAPNLVGEEKAERGKTPTDVWWNTIVPTNSKEKTGYPTQKPLGILERVVRVHSHPGDHILDFFAGSGTTGDAAGRNERHFMLIDANPEAASVMAKRLERFSPECVGFVL